MAYKLSLRIRNKTYLAWPARTFFVPLDGLLPGGHAGDHERVNMADRTAVSTIRRETDRSPLAERNTEPSDTGGRRVMAPATRNYQQAVVPWAKPTECGQYERGGRQPLREGSGHSWGAGQVG